jgi:transposase-like protein
MMMNNSKGKRFPSEFKAEAIRLLLTSGKTQEQLGKELGVSGVTLAALSQIS